MSRSHPLVPSVQNLYRSLSERSQSSWLLTCTRMWTFQKNDLPHTWLPETTGQWGRGPQRPQVARRHSRPRLPGTCSARFYIKGNDSHFHRTNSTFVFISRTDEIMPLASAEEHPSNKMFATPGRLRGTWVRQSLLGPAALLLQASSSQESANSTYLQCFKTLWRELLRLTILYSFCFV